MTIQLDPPRDPESSLSPPSRRRKAGAGGWFRAFWRWHFYASFIVAPILLVLASTGLIYLLRFQIEPLLHADLMRVEAQAGHVTQPYAAQQSAVARAHPDATLVSMTEPAGPDRSTVFSTTLPDGAVRDVYVNPWNAEVLGSINPDTTLSGYAVRLHRDLMTGVVGDRIIEIAACWALVMALTGYFLFFKGRRARVRRTRSGKPGARLRSAHGWIGTVAGVGLLLLIVSGLPWTGVWGEKAQQLATNQGTSLWSLDHGAQSKPSSTLDESLPHSHAQDIPWAQGGTKVPQSTPPAHGSPGAGERNVANVDTAVGVADEQGLRHPMTIALPSTDTGVFSVIGYAFDAPSDERTVHVDRFDGQVVSTYGFSDYPALAKVVAHGIGLHEGRSLGLWSFWGALLMCLAVIAACVTGPLMWWRRRPKGSGSMSAPRGRMPIKGSPLLLVALIALGVFLPLFGITLVAVLVLDHLVLRRIPALAGWFDSV